MHIFDVTREIVYSATKTIILLLYQNNNSITIVTVIKDTKILV